MTTHASRPFNEWLRAELKARRMSQRQLAERSGVDHSTISRIVSFDREPSLGTATKLARGLRLLGPGSDASDYVSGVATGGTHPSARIEYALRADPWLGEAQVHQVMEYYLAVRTGRRGMPGGATANVSTSRQRAATSHGGIATTHERGSSAS